MADYYTFSQGSGGTAAADDIGGTIHPRIKIEWGADGAANDTAAATPLPVSEINGTTTLVTRVGNVGTMEAGTITTLPNIPGGTLGLVTRVGNVGTLEVGTIAALPNIPGGTVGLVSRVGNVGTLEVGTIAALPNIPGGTVGLITRVGNVGTLEVGTISAMPNIPGGTVGLVTRTGNVGTVESGTITSVGSVASVGMVYGGTITLAAGTATVGVANRGVVGYTPIRRYAAITGTADGTVWTPGSGKKYVLTDIVISANAAGVCTVKDGTATMYTLSFAANGGWSSNFQTPGTSSANDTSLMMNASAGTMYVTAQGYEV